MGHLPNVAQVEAQVGLQPTFADTETFVLCTIEVRHFLAITILNLDGCSRQYNINTWVSLIIFILFLLLLCFLKNLGIFI